MNILDVTPQGYVVVGLQNIGEAPKTVVNKFFVDDQRLSDWYPVYKSAEYRYDEESDCVRLNRDYKWEPTTFLNFMLPEQDIDIDDLVEGNVPAIKQINESIIKTAYEMFSLPDPNKLLFIEDFEMAISQSLLVLDNLFTQSNLATYFEEDDKKAILKVKEFEMKIEVAGAMYSFYRAYRRVLSKRK